jgi:hypothetical protein
LSSLAFPELIFHKTLWHICGLLKLGGKKAQSFAARHLSPPERPAAAGRASFADLGANVPFAKAG